jgi:uncharacterized protein
VSELGEVEEDPVALAVDRQRVAGTLLRPEVPVPGFLFVHGWGGDQEDDLGDAEELARLGCVCFTFDLRGHADSDADKERVTRQDGLDDVIAAYDYLAAQPGIDPTAIGVIGTSYGGYLAMLLTRERPVRWLAMRVPALYPDADWDVPKAKLDKAAVRAYREHPPAAEQDRALSACADFPGDVLVVASERDDRIPPAAIAAIQAAFRRANSFSHRVIQGATHAMRDERHQRVYRRLLVSWIEDMVRASRLTAR